MEGCRAIYQGEESYQLVNREQKEYGTKIRQWAHELQANVANIKQLTAKIVSKIKDIRGSSIKIEQITARNYEPIEMDGSNDEIDEGIIWHGNGSRKKSKIVREDGAGDEHVSSERYDLSSHKRQHIEMPRFGRLEVTDD